MRNFLSVRVSLVVALFAAGAGAFVGGGTSSQAAPADGAAEATGTVIDEEMAPAVDYLMSEYGLDEAVAADQVAFAASMEDEVPAIHDALGDSFAGAWVDNTRPGMLFVASTQPSQATDALGNLVLDATVRSAEFSQSFLADGSNRLADILEANYPDAPENDSGFAISVDIQANELDLDLAPDYPVTSALKDVIAKFIPRVEVKPTEQWISTESDDCPGRYNCEPDLRGGLQVVGRDAPHSACTLGYTMKDRLSGTRYLSTAGHCAGSPWKHSDRLIGGTEWTQNDGAVDGKIININDRSYWNAKAWVFRPNDHAVEVTQKIDTPGDSLEGITLCVSGAGNGGGQRCGELTDWNFDPEEPLGLAGKVNEDACGGDSGGPWYNYYTDRAYGIHSGSSTGCDFSGFAYFSWISFFENASGKELAFAN